MKSRFEFMEKIRLLLFPAQQDLEPLYRSVFTEDLWRLDFLYHSDKNVAAQALSAMNEITWLLIEGKVIEKREDLEQFEIFQNILNQHKEFGLIFFDKKIDEEQDGQSHNKQFFLKCLKDRLYAASLSIAPPTDDSSNDSFKKYSFSGFLKFQSPDFAKRSALFLSFLSKDPDRMNLGLWELFINGIEHGNLNIDHEEKRKHVENNDMDLLVQQRLRQTENKQKYVQVFFKINENEAIFQITDDGLGFDWKNYLNIEEERILDKNGRGIALARIAAFDELSYKGKGNEVFCKIKFL